MPSTYAHYRMGQQVRKMLRGHEKEVLEKYPQLYLIGLHGPDILFYYKPLKSNAINKIGYELHDHSGQEFFERAKKLILQKTDKDPYLAYTYGVLNHFALDVNCHGYIEDKISASGISHGEIEVEFDRELMVRDKKNPVTQLLTKHIVPSEENTRIISEFYPGTSMQEMQEALRGMIFYNNLLVAPSHIKRWGVCLLLKLSGNYKEMKGLMVNYHKNAGISSVDYLAYWGYAASLVTLIVAVLGPVFGTLADTKGFKKPIFLGCVIGGCLACLAMGLASWWISFLVVFIIAKVCFSASLIFYDSMLSDVTSDERMDEVSSNGYAYGYAGSCIPFLISLIFVLGYSKNQGYPK